MERNVIEAVIKDCGVPGRVVELDGKLLKIDIFNQRTESFERLHLGISEFCDLVLDWRARRPQPAASAQLAA